MSHPSTARAGLAGLALILAGLPAAAADGVSFDCVIDPSAQVKLGSPAPGVIDQVLVDRGQIVKKGDPVARLENSIEAATVELDRITAESNEAIQSQETKLALAKSRYDRARQLAVNNVVAAKDVEALDADVKVGERDLAIEKLKKRLAELELARSQALLERRTIRSPIDGLVSERHLGPGEYTSQDAAVVTIVALDPLFVETFVPVAYWGRIVEGVTGTVTLDQPIGGSYPATVSVVDRVFDSASGTFGVRLVLPNPQDKLPAGQRCSVAFQVAVAAK